jgi:Tol biopolymer transport system component
MNKNLIDQLPTDEKPVAEKISSAAEQMKLSQSFQWNLETELMNAYKPKLQENRVMKLLSPAGWVIAVIAGVLLMSWFLRTLLPTIQPAAAPTAVQEDRFETDLRQGNICPGSLALAHGFDVFLTNKNKTGFVPVDTGNTLDELRSFAWSADGERLAVVGNTVGSGNIYITDLTGGGSGNLLSASEAGYVRDAAWSRDGRQFALWSSQNLTTLYLLNALGHGMIEKQLDVQIVGTPQFAPDGSIVFYGADKNAAGLFLLTAEGSQPTLVLPFVQDLSGFAFSPDGSLLAYMEYDREKGEARLSTQKPSKGEYKVLGALPIPQNSGAALPKVANLSWSPDGTFLVFDLKQPAAGRTIYLARADGTGLVQVVESGYAPTISADGRCLAYINNKQVFLLDMADVASDPTTATPVLLADLPAGRGSPFSELDKLQWSP